MKNGQKIDCSEIAEHIYDLVLAEPLSGEIRQRVRSHISVCPRCRRRYRELKLSWHSLSRMEKIRFPRRLSRSVLRELSPEGGSEGFFRRLEAILPPWVLVRSAALMLVVGLGLGVFYFIRQGGEEAGRADHSLLTFRRDLQSLPDVQITLKQYLDRSGNILAALERGEYVRWKDMMGDIFRDDIQGQGNFLLESLGPDSSARPLVQKLHQTFWSLLRTARSQGKAEINLPPGLNTSLLLKEIQDYREKNDY